MDYHQMSFDLWMEVGVTNGWATAPVCATHDGIPMTEHEVELNDEGDDICIHIIRLTTSKEEQAEVEKDHAPSAWRRKNAGL